MSSSSTQKKSGTDWKRLGNMWDDDIDFSDIPPVEKTALEKLVIRMPERKAPMSIRLDPHIISWFKRQGDGYQTRINAVLKSYVEAHSRS